MGIGLQTAYPFSGASLKYKFNDSFSVQGILGIVFESTLSSIRALYHFKTSETMTSYGFGQIGQYSVSGFKINDDLKIKKTTEKSFGYGFGLGVEYNAENLGTNAPLWINLELVYGNIEFKEVDFNFSVITIGGGLHYYF